MLLLYSSFLLIILWTTRAIYRIFFHPLSRYPGSIVAIIFPSWYEWYWNYYHNGELLFEIEREHCRNGSIIRIGVNELHVNDPEIFQEMTKVGSKFTKDPHLYSFISFPGTSIGFIDPAGHRVRRQVLTPAFSPARVQELAPMIQSKITKLLNRFKNLSNPSNPQAVNIHAACKALTIDVISEIVLGQDFQCLDHPQFRNEFIERLHSAFSMGWTATAFPTLTNMSMMLPDWLSKAVFPLPILFFKEASLQLSWTFTPSLLR